MSGPLLAFCRTPRRALGAVGEDGRRSQMVVTRGFTGRRRGTRDPRLPPGQYDAGMDWPVLHAEPTPSIDTAGWSFEIDGLVDKPVRWSWEEIHSLPASRYAGAIHCVTTWSKFGMRFDGVSVDTLLDVAGVGDGAAFALARSRTGYTTNFPLEDLTGGKAWVVWDVDGAPLPSIHGGPARLLVPHLYFWKSAKWVSGLTLLAEEQLGFWEQRGYHDRGDPWLEQRYQGD
jgi:DMSO/TMAO reductase YedYZ molybdopterin-dependent catalytic subunit